MKLLFCRACHDLFRLPADGSPKRCSCGKSVGIYLNEKLARYQGPCVPLGIDNNSLAKVIKGSANAQVPYEDLDIHLFRFREASTSVEFSANERDRSLREVQGFLDLFEAPRKIK